MPARVCDDRVLSEDATARWCPHCSTWKPLDATNFYRQARGYNGFQRTCKTCRKGRSRGTILLSHIRPWLRELVAKLGWTHTARRLGVTNSMLSRWLGKQRRIQKRNAARVLGLCAEVGVRVAV